jgi:hypothetical protein
LINKMTSEVNRAMSTDPRRLGVLGWSMGFGSTCTWSWPACCTAATCWGIRCKFESRGNSPHQLARKTKTMVLWQTNHWVYVHHWVCARMREVGRSVVDVIHSEKGTPSTNLQTSVLPPD